MSYQIRRVLSAAARAGQLMLLAGLTIAGIDAPAHHAMAQPSPSEINAMKALYQRPASVPYPAHNTFTEAKAALGRQLFFDPRLSGTAAMSCASCHQPGLAWGDGRRTGVGSAGNDLTRRTPTILNLAWGEMFFWDGRADTLEEQALAPIQNPLEMNMPLPRLVEVLNGVKAYRAAFNAVFPGEGVSPATIGKALATFQRGVVSAVAPFDRWVTGDEKAIDESAKRGFVLFNTTARCSACHSGWRFTDDSFHDIGLPDSDLGRGKVVEGVELLRHAFKTPSLRNVAQRAPYMHNGSVRTLDDVVHHYSTGFVFRPSKSPEMHRLNLTTRDVQDIVAFMNTLTSADPVMAAPDLPAKE
jgi:cytochrome c peroxidase